jgi:hypothetical protein
MIIEGSLMMAKKPNLIVKASQKMGEPIVGHFAMLELAALGGLADLVRESPKAAELIVQLIRRMHAGSGGVVIASRETMRELLGCSMPTVDRSLKVLIEGGWVQRIKVGGTPALAINHRVAWIGPRGNIQHAVFGATVIASRSEQDALSLSPPPMRNVPILQQGEQAVAHGEGLPPPSQPGLDGLPQAAIERDPNTIDWVGQEQQP